MESETKILLRERAEHFGMALLITMGFLVPYWLVQRNVSSAYDLSIGLDNAIPFIDWTIWVYVSDMLFFTMVSVLIDRAYFWKMFKVLIITYLLCIPWYFLLPSDYPRISLDMIQSDFYRWGYGVMHWVDSPNNTFPSLHVGMTWIASVALSRKYPRFVWLIYGYASAVSVSVLTTKQHFIVDVVGGLVVVVIAFKLYALYDMRYKQTKTQAVE